MKHYFLVNPAAGQKDSSSEIGDTITRVCTERGVDFEVHVTQGNGDTTAFVRAHADEGDVRFYACGGDGTVCDVVNGAAGHSGAQVAVIPCGTGNDFVKNFTNTQNFLDINAQLDGTPIMIDLLKLDDLYVANMVNIGFDCEVVSKTSQLKRHAWVPRGMAYLLGVLVTLIRKPGVKADIAVDDGDFQPCAYLLTAIANGSWCGGGYFNAPHASLCDGQMDGIFIDDVSRLKFLSLQGEYKAGTYENGKAGAIVHGFKCHKLQMRFPAAQNICIDGEIVAKNEFTLTVASNALQLSVPAGSQMIEKH